MTLPPHIAEYHRRFVQPKLRSEQTRPYIAGLFSDQLDFVRDPAPQKAALCTRRAGKTEALAAWFLDAAEDCPGGLSVYITQTKPLARKILWNTLRAIDTRHGLGLKFTEIDGQLTVVTPNRHHIWLAGCADRSEIDKFRGVRGVEKAGLRRAAVDEAQAFPAWLRELVDESLLPTLADQQGELAIVGTPSPVPAGPFYEWTTGDGPDPAWPTHRWSVLDNPHLPHIRDWIEALKTRKGWGDEHPTYLREWRGQWVMDRGALVYPFRSDRNVIDTSSVEWQWFQSCSPSDRIYILAIDIGASEETKSTAFVLIGFARGMPNVFVLKAWKKAGMIPTSIAAEILKVKAEYPRISKIVMDEGGLGSGYSKEINTRFGLGVEPAQKKEKRAYIEFVAGDLESGVVKVDPWECRELVDEWTILPWDEEHLAPDERFPDHAADGALYGLREARTYYRPVENDPEPGTPEAINREVTRAKEERARELAKTARSRRQGGLR